MTFPYHVLISVSTITMKYSLAVLILFVAGLEFSSSADCTSKPDGKYQIDCESYYICINGTSEIHNCPTPPAENIVFNNVSKICDKPANVGPPCNNFHYDCTSKGDGDYADIKTQCRRFAVCYNGKLQGFQHCASDLVFDEINQTCNWKENVAPPCGTKV